MGKKGWTRDWFILFLLLTNVVCALGCSCVSFLLLILLFFFFFTGECFYYIDFWNRGCARIVIVEVHETLFLYLYLSLSHTH